MDKTWLKLLYANTEAEVSEIINSHADMKNDSNWHPIDDRDTNRNVVGNQSSNGGKAATELITNMVDSMLTKRCLEEGIDPKSDEAPSTMYNAVDKFIENLQGGKIIKADDSWLRKYSSENLVIGVVGARKGEKRPCYVFCDNGEGQHPKDFKGTFLSLSAKNKSQIKFVQGKYNMGSSGVLSFCGKCWYKLIISRRYTKDGEWGWTLIRKNTPEAGLPYAEYYALGKEIQSVEKSQIFPFKISSGEKFEQFSLESGTIIKLYDYNLGKKYKKLNGIREVFNENIVETILPFRIMDFRATPDKKRGGRRAMGIDERSFYGMEFSLQRHTHGEDEDDNGDRAEIEPEDKNIMHIATHKSVELGEITITAIALKKGFGKSNWGESFARVFHHINGQVQYKNQRGFLTQCGFPALKDRVVIFVDASKLTDASHHSIWKGDRESIYEIDTGDDYMDRVKEAIKKSKDLRELHHRIAKEELESVARDSSKELIQDLVKRDKNLLLLLDGKTPDVPLGKVPQSQPLPQRGDLRYNPTYVKIKRSSRKYKLPINRMCLIECETDAEDVFFIRADNRGFLLFSGDKPTGKLSINHTLVNGKLMLSIFSDSLASVGDELRFKIGINSEAMSVPVYTDEIVINIADKSPFKSRPIAPPPPSGGLPDHRLLTIDGRTVAGEKTQKYEDGFDQKDGGYVSNLGADGKIYYINYDNSSFQSYYKLQKTDADKKAAETKYILGMRILMLGLESALTSSSNEVKGKIDNDIFHRMAAKGVAQVVLTLCDQLPKSFDILKDKGEE